MNVVTNSEATTTTQDVRRKASLGGGIEEFGIALEAQIATAGIARGSRTEIGREKMAAKRNDLLDPTTAAEEKLASRPDQGALGVQAAVKAEATSVSAEEDGTSATTGRGGEDAQRSSDEQKPSAVRAANDEGTAAASESKALTSPSQSKATDPAATGNDAAQSGRNMGIAGQTGNPAAGRLEASTSIQSAAGVGAIGGSDKSSTSARGGGVSAAEALGALGRKTLFKVQETERAAKGADVEKFAAQASKALAAAVRREGGTIVMRLSPENLGLLKVRIETKNGSVNARVEASESSARQLLIKDVESLRTALEAHGVCVEKIEIVRMDDLQGTGLGQGPGTGLGDSGRQAEDRQRDAGAGRMDAMQDEAAGRFMDEPAGIYLCGVELRVDAIA